MQAASLPHPGLIYLLKNHLNCTRHGIHKDALRANSVVARDGVGKDTFDERPFNDRGADAVPAGRHAANACLLRGRRHRTQQITGD